MSLRVVDGTTVVEAIALGFAAGVVSLLISILIATAVRRRARPPAAGSR